MNSINQALPATSNVATGRHSAAMLMGSDLRGGAKY